MITASIKFDKNYFNRIKKYTVDQIWERLKYWLMKAWKVFLEECKRLTPEDTREMIHSYRISDVEKFGNNYRIVISNESDHAIYVEYGVRWQTFNYHKPKWSVFYSWFGNRTMARALDSKKEEMNKILLDSIK